jgi:hypothetical protein
MVTISLVRYLFADAMRGQRGIAPVLFFLVSAAILDVRTGAVLPNYGATAVVLFPVALWITVLVSGSEDAVQAAITTVTAGGAVPVLVARLLCAYLVTWPLALVALAWPVILGNGISAGTLLAGLVAHLVTALAGVGFGALISPPVVRRPAWSGLLGVLVVLVELAVPYAPPARQLLTLFGDHTANRTSALTGSVALGLTLIALQTVVLATLSGVAAYRLGQQRT